MDSSVLAALISAPVALLASAAAYAAGRAQGRGAYQGPVAAVRRQHQREAYAALVTAANTYITQTEWGVCLQEARNQVGIAAFTDDSLEQEVNRRAARVRATVPVEPLRAAASVVFLEGPEHIAELAGTIVNRADQVRSHARAGNGPGGVLDELMAGRQPEVPAAYRLIQAIDAFTDAARSHLNGGDSSP
ncbi:hypothetical protein AB0D87_25960 [Streptomyces sp. NPDC048342]|uniref:hypothetical protein n=1 Tax=unclassified Streptomyces TaxID=2593676 RepID=UPI003441DD90